MNIIEIVIPEVNAQTAIMPRMNAEVVVSLIGPPGAKGDAGNAFPDVIDLGGPFTSTGA